MYDKLKVEDETEVQVETQSSQQTQSSSSSSGGPSNPEHDKTFEDSQELRDKRKDNLNNLLINCGYDIQMLSPMTKSIENLGDETIRKAFNVIDAAIQSVLTTITKDPEDVKNIWMQYEKSGRLNRLITCDEYLYSKLKAYIDSYELQPIESRVQIVAIL